MPPLSSVRRNCFYPTFESTFELTHEGGVRGGGIRRVCVSILCILQVLKMKKKCLAVLSLLRRFESEPQLAENTVVCLIFKTCNFLIVKGTFYLNGMQLS